MISVRQIFNPTLFVMHNVILCYNRHTDPAKPYDALRVCVSAVKLKEVFKICHEGVAGGHRGVAGTLDKFQRTFFAMSACEKIRRLVDQCNTCLAKEMEYSSQKRASHAQHTGQGRGVSIYRLSLNIRNYEKESLFADGTGWIYKIC